MTWKFQHVKDKYDIALRNELHRLGLEKKVVYSMEIQQGTEGLNAYFHSFVNEV